MSKNVIKFPSGYDPPPQQEQTPANEPKRNAEEHFIEGRLDLNRYLIKHPVSTYYVRVSGDSMTGAGIQPRDLLIVDRAEQTHSGDIIIACLYDELCVKRLRILRGETVLMPENPIYDPIKITKGMGFEVWGKVLHVIHSFDQEAD